jgi:CBS domain containing-hemolysin-like protein
MHILLHTLGALVFVAGLVVFAYLDRVYRELGRVTAGRVHQNLDIFEAEVEPRLKLERRLASRTFSLLANLWLVAVAVETAIAVFFAVAQPAEAVIETIFFLVLEVLVAVHLIPMILLARTSGRWLGPLVPVVRVFGWLARPLETAMSFALTVAHLSEEEPEAAPELGEGIEAFVEAAEEEGILERDEAAMIEQVVEFSDKRVREVMTPRPDVVSIAAGATIEDLRELMVQTKFSRIPVHENSLDEVIGIVYARDLLPISESEAARRNVRELARPALFVPETKLGSELLKEMQQKNQQMAIVIDEYGLVAGLVTVEDLVEEIVGEIGEEDRQPAPDVVRESADSMVLRGSIPVEKLEELFGIELRCGLGEAATTVAGLLNNLVGHVPAAGEMIEHDGLRFEVLEANQRKVLRLRARRLAASAAHPADLA